MGKVSGQEAKDFRSSTATGSGWPSERTCLAKKSQSTHKVLDNLSCSKLPCENYFWGLSLSVELVSKTTVVLPSSDLLEWTQSLIVT